MTSNQVTQLIKSCIEDDTVPAAIAAACEKYQGKTVSKRLAAHVAEATGIDRVWISRRYGWTSLDWYDSNNNPQYVILDRVERNATTPTPEALAEDNGRYYHALQKRNAKRRETLADPCAVPGLLIAYNAFKDAKSDLDTYSETLEDSSRILKALEG